MRATALVVRLAAGPRVAIGHLAAKSEAAKSEGVAVVEARVEARVVAEMVSQS